MGTVRVLAISVVLTLSLARAESPKAPVAAKTVKAFPTKTWLESIAVGPKGTFFTSSYPDGNIYEIDSSGNSKLVAHVDGTIAGLAFQCPGDLLVSGWIGGKEPVVFHVSGDGKAEILLKLEGAMFPNGWTHLKGS